MEILDKRKDCPMRHMNGNCLPCGGFCTAVNDEICEALHNAYQHGYDDCKVAVVIGGMSDECTY